VKLPDKHVRYNPLKSVRYASRGIYTAFLREPNLALQCFIGLAASSVAWVYELYSIAYLNLLMMGIVVSLELINSGIEILCDIIKMEYDERIKVAKDMSAGAVLVASLVWLTLIIFELSLIYQSYL
jgi:diacylglycerol kinase